MLKIWGRVNSVNVKKALWCAEELGLKYERVDAGMQFGVTKTPEYLRMNPNSLVPTIEDDGFVLWESHTIVRYLSAKHSMGKLHPSDLKARADAERWMDWAFTFQTAMRAVFWGLIRTPAEKRDAKRVFLIVSRTLNTRTDEIEKIRRTLGGRHVATFDGIAEHTTRRQAAEVARQAEDARADLVVAVGGGSAIDLAKIVIMAMEHDIPDEAGFDPFPMGPRVTVSPFRSPKIRQIAVPSKQE